MLDKATSELKNCRDEYNCLLEESRDPFFRSEVGLEQLNRAKADVKGELKSAESKFKFLEGDVKRLEKSIKDMPVSQSEYEKMISEQGQYLNSIAEHNDDEEEAFDFYTAADSVLITGPFDECPEIKRIERSSAKFQTAEQEAIQRKLELSQVKMSETTVPAEDEDDNCSVSTIRTVSSVDKSIFERRTSNEDKEPVSTPQQPRRGSVLLSANKHVLDTLNNMFSSGGRNGEVENTVKMGISSNRNSIFSPSVRRDSVMTVNSDGGTVATEKKAAKSKTLKVSLALLSDVVCL